VRVPPDGPASLVAGASPLDEATSKAPSSTFNGTAVDPTATSTSPPPPPRVPMGEEVVDALRAQLQRSVGNSLETLSAVLGLDRGRIVVGGGLTPTPPRAVNHGPSSSSSSAAAAAGPHLVAGLVQAAVASNQQLMGQIGLASASSSALEGGAMEALAVSGGVGGVGGAGGRRHGGPCCEWRSGRCGRCWRTAPWRPLL